MQKELATQTTVERVESYYSQSPEYLTGDLRGTCHFGKTEIGQPFELNSALKSMELFLGDKLGLPPGSSVLSAGSGYGRVETRLANEYGYNVIGAEMMEERMSEARGFTRESVNLGAVHLVRTDYTLLPIESESLSGAYTMETLVHAGDLQKALAGFWRVLKPNGRLVLFEYSVPDWNTLGPIRRKISNDMVLRIGMPSIKHFSHDAFPSILKKAGFKNVEVEDISQNVWPMWRWLFMKAIDKTWSAIRKKEFMENTNLIASLLIWPYRHQLGYKVVTANKPK